MATAIPVVTTLAGAVKTAGTILTFANTAFTAYQAYKAYQAGPKTIEDQARESVELRKEIDRVERSTRSYNHLGGTYQPVDQSGQNSVN